MVDIGIQGHTGDDHGNCEYPFNSAIEMLLLTYVITYLLGSMAQWL